MRAKARNEASARRRAPRASRRTPARRMLSMARRRRPRQTRKAARAPISAAAIRPAVPARAAHPRDALRDGRGAGVGKPRSGGELLLQVRDELVDTFQRHQIGDLDRNLEAIFDVVDEIEDREGVEPQPIEPAVQLDLGDVHLELLLLFEQLSERGDDLLAGHVDVGGGQGRRPSLIRPPPYHGGRADSEGTAADRGRAGNDMARQDAVDLRGEILQDAWRGDVNVDSAGRSARLGARRRDRNAEEAPRANASPANRRRTPRWHTS